MRETPVPAGAGEALTPPSPDSSRRPAARGGEWAGDTRAADRNACCKNCVRSSRFSAERARAYFATACRKGKDNRVVPPRFSFPLHPLSSPLLGRTPYDDNDTITVKVAVRLSDKSDGSDKSDAPGRGTRLAGFCGKFRKKSGKKGIFSGKAFAIPEIGYIFNLYRSLDDRGSK